MKLSDIDAQRAGCLNIVASAAGLAARCVLEDDRYAVDEAMRALLSALDTYEHLTTLAGPAEPGKPALGAPQPLRKAPWHA
jgi:hypothetical protein